MGFRGKGEPVYTSGRKTWRGQAATGSLIQKFELGVSPEINTHEARNLRDASHPGAHLCVEACADGRKVWMAVSDKAAEETLVHLGSFPEMGLAEARAVITA